MATDNSKRVYDGAIVRSILTDEEYEVLQVSGDQILVSPKDADVDENGDLPGFWSSIDEFEIEICLQHGSGHGTYMTWTSIKE